MAVDACRGSDAPFDEKLHVARNQSGQRFIAARLKTLLDG
ncbi:MAG: hypothetical protein IH973_08670, partial [Myxococcales bacterium]|nr:hypothetical protein [Myxococcales bacterium]